MLKLLRLTALLLLFPFIDVQVLLRRVSLTAGCLSCATLQQGSEEHYRLSGSPLCLATKMSERLSTYLLNNFNYIIF